MMAGVTGRRRRGAPSLPRAPKPAASYHLPLCALQDLRPAAGGSAGILWQCYLSLSCLNGAAVPGEAVAQALQAQVAAE